jgi:two-component system response regulator DesR
VTSATPETISVLLTGTCGLMRAALAGVLAAEDGIEVCAEPETADGLARSVRCLRPGVVVVDLEHSGTGLGMVEWVHRNSPGSAVLALTSSERPGLINRALRARALGLLDKDTGTHRLVDVIRRVASGERAVDPSLAATALCAPTNPLSAREAEVLRLAGAGHSVAETASALHLSPGTVRNYLSRAIAGTGATTRVGAVKAAERAGWL